MGVRQTSLLAYSEALEGLGDKQKQVYDAILDLGICYDKQIANHLGWEINSVTPRRNELDKMGKIEEAGLVKNLSYRSVMSWKVKI